MSWLLFLDTLVVNDQSAHYYPEIKTLEPQGGLPQWGSV